MNKEVTLKLRKEEQLRNLKILSILHHPHNSHNPQPQPSPFPWANLPQQPCSNLANVQNKQSLFRAWFCRKYSSDKLLCITERCRGSIKQKELGASVLPRPHRHGRLLGRLSFFTPS